MLENWISGGTWAEAELLLAVWAARERTRDRNPSDRQARRSFMGGFLLQGIWISEGPDCLGKKPVRRFGSGQWRKSGVPKTWGELCSVAEGLSSCKGLP